MNISIVGAGNIGTQLAVHSAAKGHNVCVFSSNCDKISKKLKIIDECGDLFLEAVINGATDNPKSAFYDADLIFVTVPAFCMQKTADTIIPYLKSGAMLCLVPGSGGGEFAFKKALDKGCVIFGLQRVPSVARLIEYGKTVCASGYRQQLFVASLPAEFGKQCAKIVSDLVDIPCTAMPNYLNLTLTPSNPILHTTRLKTIFKDYKHGIYYERLPLFYEEWNDESSELLLKCDAEVQKICYALNDFDLSYVKSLKEHYESATATALTKKIAGIAAFKGLKTPSVKTDKGYLPDFSSRYFTADFSYGLAILIQIADFLNINCDNMKETMYWYNNQVENDNIFKFSEHGIFSAQDFINFYK